LTLSHNDIRILTRPLFPDESKGLSKTLDYWIGDAGESFCALFYSKRKISTGRMFDADRAGKIVAATLIASAAAVIQIASVPFA